MQISHKQTVDTRPVSDSLNRPGNEAELPCAVINIGMQTIIMSCSKVVSQANQPSVDQFKYHAQGKEESGGTR